MSEWEDQVAMLKAERDDLQRQVDAWKARWKKYLTPAGFDLLLTNGVCEDQEEMIAKLTPALKEDHGHSIRCCHGPECEVCQLISQAEGWLAEPLFSEDSQ